VTAGKQWAIVMAFFAKAAKIPRKSATAVKTNVTPGAPSFLTRI